MALSVFSPKQPAKPTNPYTPPLPRSYQPAFRKQVFETQSRLAAERQAQQDFDTQLLQQQDAQQQIARDEALAKKYREGTLSRDEFAQIFGREFDSKYGKKSADALSFAYSKYKVGSGKNLSDDERRNFGISGMIIGREIRKELGGGLQPITIGVKRKNEYSVSNEQERFFIENEPVISGYSSVTGESVFQTRKGEFRQAPASFEKTPVSFEPLQFSHKDTGLALPKGFGVVGNADAAQFDKIAPKMIFSAEDPKILKEFSDKRNAAIAEEKRLQGFGLFRPIEEAVPTVLNISKGISEAPYQIGSNVFRGIAETGRGIGKGLYQETGLAITTDDTGFQTFTIVPKEKRAKVASEFSPLISDKEFPVLRERQAILGGTAVGLIPYTATGPVSTVFKVADLGAAFKESPEKAVNLIGVGVASSVLFNQLGSVKKVVTGQLGGTIAGSTGTAKAFETITGIGGKAIGVSLLVPYAAQELPPLYESFQKGNAKEFGERFASLQRTRAPLALGSNIGQKLSTGFTLFQGTRNTIISGGLTAPTETLARKRLIANVFDAKAGDFVKVGDKVTDVSSIRQLYESQGFTKQKFLESYDTVFTGLNRARIPVKEFNPAKIEAISTDPKAQRIVMNYFRKNSDDFFIYGSTVQGPQLSGVKTRLSGDVDILARDPKGFLTGLNQALIKGGVSKSKLDLFTGVEKSYLSFQGKKFLSVYDIGKDQAFFSQLESVGSLLPRRVFAQTPSGINLSSIRFQAGRKVVGGFVDLREKDIGDVLTITRGVEKQLPSYSKFGLTPYGRFVSITGLSVPGTTVGDVLTIGPGSDVARKLAKLENVPARELVSKLKKIPFKPVVSFRAAASFRFGDEPTLITTNPLYNTISFGNYQTEASLTHELVHASDYLTGKPVLPDKGKSYFNQPAEIRAVKFENDFLKSRGALVENLKVIRTPRGEKIEFVKDDPFDLFRFGPSRREARLQRLLGDKYIPPALTAKQKFQLMSDQTLGFGRRSIRDVSPIKGSSTTIAGTGPNRSAFGLTHRGEDLLRNELPAKETGLRVKDILRIGPESQPIRDISSITGVSPNRLVKRIGRLPVEGFSPIEKIRFGPTVGASTGPLESGRLGLKIRRLPSKLSDKTFEESVIAHELEHAGERIAGITSGRPRSAADYFISPSERRAYGVQERFLESKGRDLPSDILFRTGVKGDSSLIGRVKDVPVRTYTKSEIEKLYSQAARITTSNRKDGVVSSRNLLSPEYPLVTKPSYIPYVPVPARAYPAIVPRSRQPYVAPAPYRAKSPIIPTSVYAPVSIPKSPYAPIRRSEYTPRPLPPSNFVGPYTPPALVPNEYVPPTTPSTPIAPYIPFMPTRTTLTPPRVSRLPKSPSIDKRFRRLKPGFLPVLYRKGKPIRTLYPEALTAKDALAVGASFVQGNIKRSFRLKAYGQAEDKGFVGPLGILRRGKRNPYLFVEKTQFAINTRGEKGALRYARDQQKVRVGKLLSPGRLLGRVY